MKVAVISDIHANMTALKTVLEDIKKQNCDKIFVSVIWRWQGPSLMRQSILSAAKKIGR